MCFGASGFRVEDLGFASFEVQGMLGGPCGFVSRVISTLIGVISNSNCSYHTYNPNY